MRLMNSFFFIFFFFFNDTATTEIYTLSLHDALPICGQPACAEQQRCKAVHDTAGSVVRSAAPIASGRDRKSTRLNSSHDQISYAVFCLKKKKIHNNLLVQHLTQLICYKDILAKYLC